MWNQVFWTKTMLDDFIQEALLTEDEIKILRSRIAGWSIVKLAMEYEMSTSTVSRLIKSIKNKYDNLSNLYPERFSKRLQTKFESNSDEELDNNVCIRLLSNVKVDCKKNIYNMTNEELKTCYESCPYKDFYNKL